MQNYHALLLAGLLSAGALPAQDAIAAGTFTPTATGIARGFDITGRALLIRRASGATEAYTFVQGLMPATAYGVHVHDLPCDVNAGGAHYKIDPNVAGTVRANEIWPAFTTNMNGEGFGFDSAAHIARPEAQSIVVHDTDGARIACADLAERRPVGTDLVRGSFTTLPGGTAMGYTIDGDAQMVRSHGTTYVTVRVDGLTPMTAYGAHVHALPCGINEGGGHYKIDPTVAGTVASNEIWPAFTTDSAGVGRGMAVVSHDGRPEAQSVVIHAPDGTKIACADFAGGETGPYITRGSVIVTAAGLDRGFDRLRSRAEMSRRSTGRTVVRLWVTGLAPLTSYACHVHDRPCSQGGGGHYKIDPTIAATIQANELWLDFTTDARGRAQAQVIDLQISRPEAASIVIHDTDGTRIGCIDLN
ncbi:MAG: hypothetical protein AAF628_06000 [Planctomycetota bacterium]